MPFRQQAWLSQDEPEDILSTVFSFLVQVASLASNANCLFVYFKARTEEKINWSERILKKFHLPNVFKDDVPYQPPDYFTATFQANKLHK